MWKVAIFIVTQLATFSQVQGQDLVVETAYGKIQGTTYSSPDGTTFYAWRSIPFAKPPLGELRFLAPVEPESWSGTLNGTADSAACVAVGSTTEDGTYSEDCLYLNVYSPAAANSSLALPVMFWIFGGSYTGGSASFSSFDPTPFLLDDVIVVTTNYRLGIFGFLSTEDDVIPGNAAFKDQVAALNWTKQNIGYFGGNGSDITIFGESAGAKSVGYIVVSPLAAGLFTGAIMESGSGVKGAFQTDARSNAVAVAQQLNSSITNETSSETILQVLQAADADFLASTFGSSSSPVLEVDNSTTAFLTQPLYESLAAGNFNWVPIIIGTNSEERIPLESDVADLNATLAEYDADVTLLLPVINLQEGVTAQEVSEAIKINYVGANGTFAENASEYIKWSGDDAFVRNTLKHASLQSQYTSVYFYEFSFIGTLSDDRAVIPGCGRVGHGDEVGYLFNVSSDPIGTAADYLTRRRFVRLWTNFAKTKNPTPVADDLLQNVTWTPFDTDNLQYLNIGDDLEVQYHREANNTAFWDTLWDTYSYHPYNTF